jgi:hypothetical protein
MLKLVLYGLAITAVVATARTLSRRRCGDDEVGGEPPPAPGDRTPARDTGPSVAPDPSPPPAATPSSASSGGFFSLPEDQQLALLIDLVRDTGACGEIEALASRSGCESRLHELLVRLLAMKDPRMEAATHDTLTTVVTSGMHVVQAVNRRVDDTAFKENLLYVVRDAIPTDSPLLERIFAAFQAEPHPYTRMRIVRAIGRIGGRRSRDFLTAIVQDEGALNSYAAQEARKYLR